MENNIKIVYCTLYSTTNILMNNLSEGNVEDDINDLIEDYIDNYINELLNEKFTKIEFNIILAPCSTYYKNYIIDLNDIYIKNMLFKGVKSFKFEEPHSPIINLETAQQR